MKLDYFDLISGNSILVHKVGHLHSPYLKELKPTTGIGLWKYNFYLNLLSWDKESFNKYAGIIGIKGFGAVLRHDELSLFDMVTLPSSTRVLMQEVLSFFIDENIEWDKDNRKFNIINEVSEIVGSINRDNFDEVRKMMLQLNYIGINEQDDVKPKGSQDAQELWDKAQEFLKKTAQKPQDAKELHLSNIISKLCAGHNSYNLLNIYDLTVFQLYDQFFQYGFLRSANLNENIFSNHGGDSFNIQDWLKPIINF